MSASVPEIPIFTSVPMLLPVLNFHRGRERVAEVSGGDGTCYRIYSEQRRVQNCERKASTQTSDQ